MLEVGDTRRNGRGSQAVIRLLTYSRQAPEGLADVKIANIDPVVRYTTSAQIRIGKSLHQRDDGRLSTTRRSD